LDHAFNNASVRKNFGGKRKQRQRQEIISSFVGFSLAALNLKKKIFKSR